MSQDAKFKIHSNRPLNLQSISAVGFDMDFTLCQYVTPAFDILAFDGAKDKLVKTFGYPASSITSLKFDAHSAKLFERGLVIDCSRGNFLKLDRFNYCKIAHHGFM